MYNYDYDPYNHYWRRADGGTVYSSARQAEVAADDEAYQAWLAAGGRPTAYPRDADGAESEAELADVLAVYGLSVSPSTQRLTAINTELSALDLSAVRPLRAILAAQQAGVDPDPGDVARLADLEARAVAIRATINED